MELKVSQRGDGVSVFELSGRIVAGEELDGFRKQIRHAIAGGHKKILLNLGEVSYIDSTGLGEMVLALGTVTQTVCTSCGSTLFKDDQGHWDRCRQCNSTSRKAWGQFKLCCLDRQPTDLLHFTKLNTVFEVYPTEGKALQSFE